jgi:hypothetical protein
MNIISQQECREWVATNLGGGCDWRTVEADYAHSVTYGLPLDTGVKTMLARLVTNSIDASQSGLFWITAWGVFPNHQNMALFDGYRRSLGENRPIIAAPGHVFGEPDLQELECLFGLVLYFYWDAILFDGAGTIAVRSSHDECVSVHTKDEKLLRRFTSSLESLELRQWV